MLGLDLRLIVSIMAACYQHGMALAKEALSGSGLSLHLSGLPFKHTSLEELCHSVLPPCSHHQLYYKRPPSRIWLVSGSFNLQLGSTVPSGEQQASDQHGALNPNAASELCVTNWPAQI